jgi:2-polyprenyl-3-methyl-5-hydroxy-6-metoxy-1,4-benzoquinol methylase
MSKLANHTLYKEIKKLYYSLINHDYDLPIILNLCNKYSHNQDKEYRILDVGCGYGRKISLLQQTGYKVLGVDINSQLIEINQHQGLNCVTVEDFVHTNESQFDIILMSHIIEHFSPSDLKDFMDGYLDRLKSGGYLIIATPLFTNYFYDDFDHVKPYSPLSIMMVFGKQASQVQYYSRNKLHLIDLKYRKRHYRSTYVRGKYLKSTTTRFYQFVELINSLLFHISLGFFGKKDGWVGVFKKV